MSSLVLNLTSDASVRGMVAPDGTHRFSVYDFITMACQKTDGGVYARKVFSRLIDDSSEYKNEVVASCHDLKFPGSGQRDTPTMTLRGLQRLLLILGTKVAAEFRALLEGTFTRVMAGDTSLIEVIRANSASDAPIQQAYRQALAQEPVEQPMLDDMARKRKANALLEVEIQERRIACVERVASMMDILDPDWKRDTEFCRQLQDNLKNSILNQAPEVEESEYAIPKKKELFFPKLISSLWQNTSSIVHRFIVLVKNSDDIPLREPITEMPQLKVQMAAGLDPIDYPCNSDIKHRVFGFCFKGPALTVYDLQRTPNIKEAYGVEHEGIQYICIVCFRHASRRLHAFSTLPYTIGLLPCTVIPEVVPGSNHHISIYKPFISTDDPILEMLKRPSAYKWKWHSGLMRSE